MVEMAFLFRDQDSSLPWAKKHMEPGKEQGEERLRPSKLRKHFMHQDLTMQHLTFNPLKNPNKLLCPQENSNTLTQSPSDSVVEIILVLFSIKPCFISFP